MRHGTEPSNGDLITALSLMYDVEDDYVAIAATNLLEMRIKRLRWNGPEDVMLRSLVDHVLGQEFGTAWDLH